MKTYTPIKLQMKSNKLLQLLIFHTSAFFKQYNITTDQFKTQQQ